MAFGFPARTTSSRTYQLQQDELAAVVKSALEDSGWSYEVLSDNEFLASLPFSGWTWGEDFKVRILPGGVIKAESKCITVRLPQVFDFGKNRKNIETFFALVEHAVRRGDYQRPVSAAKQEPAGQGKKAAPHTQWAGVSFRRRLIATPILPPPPNFITPVL